MVALEAGAHGGLHIPVLGRSRYDPTTLRQVRRRAQDASVVVAHGSSTLLAAATATLGTEVPFVYRSIGDPTAWLTSSGRRLRVGWAARRAAGVVALWRGAAVTWHRMLGVRPERITVIPNGASADRFRPPDGLSRAEARAGLGIPGDAQLVMYLGALSKEKRVDLAIQAVGSIEGVLLAVVGEGPERARLTALAAGLGESIRILGPSREPWNALAAADALALPSETEGQPAVAIEAGLMGLPVVATRVGGVPEIVLDGSSGRLVDPGDLDALERGLVDVLANRVAYGRRAREHCLQSFALDRIAAKWAVFLETVIKMGAIPEQHSF